jgi:hypothetical protein
VWEQLHKPSVPYDYATDSASRARDRAVFEEKVRKAYRAYYGIAEPTPSPTPTASPGPTSGP